MKVQEYQRSFNARSKTDTLLGDAYRSLCHAIASLAMEGQSLSDESVAHLDHARSAVAQAQLEIDKVRVLVDRGHQ